LTRTGDTERRLVAIFAANVESYSRLTSPDEAGTIERLTEQAILDKHFAVHNRIANTAGNSPGPASCACGQRTDGFKTFGAAPIAENTAVGGRR
jgi:hypothetical protein